MSLCKLSNSLLSVKADPSATDVAVTTIARECVRMRYVDFACESLSRLRCIDADEKAARYSQI